MDKRLSEQVRKNFKFLFDEHGFIITNEHSSDNGAFESLLLVSDEILISFEKEYYDIFVSFEKPENLERSKLDSDAWESIYVLLPFLGEDYKEQKGPFYYAFLGYNKYMDIKLAGIAKKLRKNYDRILAMFRSESALKEFRKFKKELVRQYLRNL